MGSTAEEIPVPEPPAAPAVGNNADRMDINVEHSVIELGYPDFGNNADRVDINVDDSEFKLVVRRNQAIL